MSNKSISSDRSVLITGAAGLIGSHLVERLLAADYSILGVDNFLTGREENLREAKDHPKFRFEEADVIKRFDFKNPFGLRFTQIMHFACPASPVDFETLPIEIMEVDTKGTLNGLEYARDNGSGFFIASTSECYGDPLVHPQTEEYWGNVNPVGSRSCYDEAKRFSEAATMTYHRKFGLDTRIARIFNTYGPRNRMDDGRVVPELCRQAILGEPLTIHGDGKQTRSFCYVTDLVEGILKLSETKEHFPINLGNPSEYSINDFASAVGKVLGKELKVEYLKARPDDPRKRKPDISKAQKLLDWSPKITLEEGLTKTIDAFKVELGK